MDNGPLWSQDLHGNYWLVFPNKHALVKDEIRDIFSQFGKVKMVGESGDEKGLRFVQYSCLNDVKNAVDNLNDHPKIRLIPYRPKNKNNQNNVAKEENTDIDPEKRNFFQRKPASNYNHRNSIEIRSNSDSNTPDFQNIEYESNCDKLSTCSSNASNSRMNVDCFSTNINYNDKSQMVTSPMHSPESAVDPDLKVKMLLQTRGIASNTFSTGTLINRTNVDCDYEDELPDLVASNKIKSQAMSRKVIYNADEVIVANIPNDYGSAYILHLLEKFDPLAISYVKIAPKNIRYCHVYFKSVEDSMGAETFFDKHDLCGKQLVVLRSCNLEEEIKN